MKSEALTKVGTGRQIKTGLDLARSQSQRIRTANSLSQPKETFEYLQHLTDRDVKKELQREKIRFATQDAAVEKVRRRISELRENLARTINRNRALTELRHELQKARWEGRDPVPAEKEESNPGQKLNQIEVRY